VPLTGEPYTVRAATGEPYTIDFWTSALLDQTCTLELDNRFQVIDFVLIRFRSECRDNNILYDI
jgi:hypothetical protein